MKTLLLVAIIGFVVELFGLYLWIAIIGPLPTTAIIIAAAIMAIMLGMGLVSLIVANLQKPRWRIEESKTPDEQEEK